MASFALGAVLIAGAATFLATNHGAWQIPARSNAAALANMADGTGKTGAGQVIEITAKGGYTPSTAQAKAGAPLVLKIRTDGTFDCSADLRIASIGWAQRLSPSGEVAVQIPAQKAGTALVGVCSMGMYNFKITFE